MPADACESPSRAPGDAVSKVGLFQQVYDDLRRIARGLMLRERRDHTLSATALVNEAFIRLVTAGQPQPLDDDSRLVRIAVRSMRSILIDHARRKMALKRSAERKHLALETVGSPTADRTESLMEFDDLVTLLADEDPLAAEFAKLRVYGGESVSGAGRKLGLTRWDSYRMWEFIDAWFRANGGAMRKETDYLSTARSD